MLLDPAVDFRACEEDVPLLCERRAQFEHRAVFPREVGKERSEVAGAQVGIEQQLAQRKARYLLGEGRMQLRPGDVAADRIGDGPPMMSTRQMTSTRCSASSSKGMR